MFVPSSGEKISRETIHGLEERERALRNVSPVRNRHSSISGDHPTFRSLTGTEQSTDKPPNAVEGSGISFLRALFTDAEWTENNTELLENFGRQPQMIEATLSPNVLPPREIAKAIVDDYLNRSHIQSPFLLRGDVLRLYERVYASSANSGDVTSSDLFRIFMILAVGSITAHRNGTLQAHPFGYYLAALKHFDQDFLLKGVNAIQDLMLIARFAIYHHIGTSVWDITQLCIRICIEQEMHLPCKGEQDLLQEHLRRRVFWECYMIDRYSSLTLGRPVAIADKDIEVSFPADANDEELMAANATCLNLDAFCTIHVPQATNEMSVFFCCLRLRQITSQINSRLSQSANLAVPGSTSFLVPGRVYTDLHHILNALSKWLSSTPVFENPRCLYERREWYEFICERERLSAIKHAMDLVPKRNAVPPKPLLTLCQNSAVNVIVCFANLFQQQRITYTRSYFQLLFAAGLSIMFCISATPGSRSTTSEAAAQAMDSCGEIIRFMSIKLPDARHYATIFEALHRHVSSKIGQSTHHGGGMQAAPEDTTFGSMWPNGGLTLSSQPASNLPAMSQLMPDLQQENLFSRDPLGSQDISDQMGLANPDYQQQLDFLEYDNNRILEEPYNNGNSEDVLHWAFFNNNTVWNLEASLGEYTYGNLGFNTSFFDIT